MNDWDIGTTISWSGTGGGTYYISQEYVTLVNDDLINTGNETIYLYPVEGSENNSYPYVVLRPGRTAEYYESYNSRSYIYSPDNVEFNSMGMFLREWTYIQPVLLMIISFSCLVRLFKR